MPVISGIITSVMTRSRSRFSSISASASAPLLATRAKVAEFLERTQGRAGDARIVLDHQDARAAHRALGGRMAGHRAARRGLRGSFVQPARQIERDGRAFAQRRGQGDGAARLAREAEELRESETGALAERLGGEEGLENAVEILRRDAAAGVLDRDPDEVAGWQRLDLAGAKGDILDRDCQLAGAVHRVAGVDGKVEDRVVELGAVGPDQPVLVRLDWC